VWFSRRFHSSKALLRLTSPSRHDRAVLSHVTEAPVSRWQPLKRNAAQIALLAAALCVAIFIAVY
jgi:hypothetical protein